MKFISSLTFTLQLLHRQCHHREERQPLAADDRPSRSGQQVDQEHGEGQQAGGHQVLRQQLHAGSGELPPVRKPLPAGEHRRRVGSHSGINIAETDIQTGEALVLCKFKNNGVCESDK